MDFISAPRSLPTPLQRFAFIRSQCFNCVIETGVLRRIAGLRNTLEPDPDNTGVGSFL
jgi:hypothetical protein